MSVLIIDDEPAIRTVLTAFISRAGYAVEQAGSGDDALQRLLKGDIDVAVCDVSMPGISGIDVIRQARTAGLDTSFIMMTAYASVDTAIDAMKAGALDFMIKPLRHDEVLHRLGQISDLRGLRDENQTLRRLVLGDRDQQFHFTSPSMVAIERMVAKVARTDSTILVTGESGTGKGVIARQIHQNSGRAGGPFIPVNCGAIPENLVESELFGHTKGAFTGAAASRKGLFLQADKGTIFLDEIGELPIAMQSKLLHVIEDKEVRPVGSEQARKVDVRIIAATNRNLEEMVAAGRFREDVYFRVSVFHVDVPPLRERREDIPGLLRYLLARNGPRFGYKGPIRVDPEVEEAFAAYAWPGNVREFENLIDRALLLAEGGHITLADLPPAITRTVTPGSPEAVPATGSGSLREQLRRIEHGIILRAIEDAGGDRRLAAQRLDIGLSSLYRKLEDFERQAGLNPEKTTNA
ncbi:MAG TPA: sigma-54 dependent transcriptional regulator [Burkholderiales bacterium]|nr:sigma-54 dependent transcriptional regulator [Burkholderiales bacterium]